MAEAPIEQPASDREQSPTAQKHERGRFQAAKLGSSPAVSPSQTVAEI
jgi:hypothetical protein